MSPFEIILINVTVRALVEAFPELERSRVARAAVDVVRRILDRSDWEEEQLMTAEAIASGHARVDDPDLAMHTMLAEVARDFATGRRLAGMIPTDRPPPGENVPEAPLRPSEPTPRLPPKE